MSIVNFLSSVNRIKSVKRQGWVVRGVKVPESVADHSFMMSLMCLLLAPKEIDREKAIKMAIIHDIAEAETGDIITFESWKGGGTISAKEKHGRERKALERMCTFLDGNMAEEVMGLWEEYNEQETAESRLVKDVDMAEMILQARDYHNKGNHKQPLEGFWDDRNTGKIRDERIKRLVLDIINKGR